MSCLIRRAVVADAFEACQIVRRSICELCRDDHEGDQATIDEWLANKTVPNFEAWIGSDSYRAVVAETAAGLVGFGLMNLDGLVALLYVAPPSRFQGVSKALLASLEEEARRAGIREIRLGSSATALRFYASCGFSSDGDPRPAFGITRSHPMSKRLAP